MNVTIAPEAQADLADLIAWIGRDDVAAAIRYGDGLIAKLWKSARCRSLLP